MLPIARMLICRVLFRSVTVAHYDRALSARLHAACTVFLRIVSRGRVTRVKGSLHVIVYVRHALSLGGKFTPISRVKMPRSPTSRYRFRHLVPSNCCLLPFSKILRFTELCVRLPVTVSRVGLLLLLLLLLYAVTHAPFHAPVLRPTSWPNARDRRDGEVN